jgi:hypothetical protein
MNDAVDELVSVANCDSISEEWTATHIDWKPTNKAGFENILLLFLPLNCLVLYLILFLNADIVDVSTATAALSLSSNVSSTPATALIQPVQHKQLATNSNDIPDLNDFEDQDLLDYEQQHQSGNRFTVVLSVELID